MGSDRIPEMIPEWNSVGSMRKRKPRKQWMEGVKITDDDAVNRVVEEQNFFGDEEFSLYSKEVLNKEIILIFCKPDQSESPVS